MHMQQQWQGRGKHAALCTLSAGTALAVTELPLFSQPQSCDCMVAIAACASVACQEDVSKVCSCNSPGEGSHALSQPHYNAEAKWRPVALTMRKAMMGRTCRAFSMTKGSLVNSDMRFPCTRHAHMSSYSGRVHLALQSNICPCVLARTIAAGAQHQHSLQWRNSGASCPARV